MHIKNILFIGVLALTSLNLRSNFLIDFETSMGAHDRLYHSLYKHLIANAHKRNTRWFRYTIPQVDQRAALSLLKKTYNNYKNETINKFNPKGIPHTFHQIWVGKNPFPEKYKRWQKTWQSIPGWNYKLWTDKEVEQFPLINSEAYYREKNLGARADILRLEILYREGGVYIDTDFECIRPEMFDVLNGSFDFYCGLQPLDGDRLLANNALIGSIPGHPILKACIDQLPLQAQNLAPSKLQIILRGPGLFTAMIFKHMNKEYKDIVFPATYFYPLGLTQLKKRPYSLLPFTDESFELIKKDVLKPETIAIHWWEGSYGLPSAQVH